MKGIKNDISFLIGDYLNLYEAQSTWNLNMPLRYIVYLAELYKGYVEENHLDIYSSTQLKLPTPRCIVFYNGVKKIEDVKHAVNYCVENGVLADFLEKHRAEVTNVILSEYNAQQHIENEKEISYRDGKAAGVREGSIRSYIEIYSEQGLPDDEIRKKLKGRFQIEDMQLEEYMKKYSEIL